jgi:hypothetical protein
MTSEQAQGCYRAAWNQWLLTSDPDAKRALGRIMDFFQPYIANSPKDPPGVWDAFIDTLPGYREWWAAAHERAKKSVEQKYPNVMEQLN